MTADRDGRSPSRGNGRCVTCEVRNGLPTIRGGGRGHYLSRQDGRRMLVLERRKGDRIRINDSAEVIVLEVHLDQVKVTIEYLQDAAVEPADQRDNHVQGNACSKAASNGGRSIQCEP